ncbi:MAG: efflux RND transporter periplasmic adaptor subunit [Calditrichaeota bacterium]|nr:efflux RND transporter periplasmic adaptor subunit [Calditrichota bacterium]
MRRLFLWLVIVLLAGLMAFRFLQRRQAKASRTIYEIQSVEGFPVKVAPAASGQFKLTRRVSGTIVGRAEAEIVPMIGEYVARVMVREGQRVDEGAIICELSRENPSASYQQARLAYDNAVREYDRISALFEKGAVSRQVFDGVTLARDIAKRNYDASERLLTLTSPIGGVVTELKAEPGRFAAPGMPLGKVVASDKLRLQVELPAGDRGLLETGTRCRVFADGSESSGRVERLAFSADKEARSFTAWIAIDERPDAVSFSPGLMAEAELYVLDLQEAMQVEPEALQRHGDRWFVYVVESDRARRVPVVLGGRNHAAAWIQSGLEAGAQVVVSGAEILEDGARVRIINAG